MKIITALALAGALALAASPALALPPHPNENAAKGQENKPTTPGPSANAKGQANKPARPGPSAKAESKRKAYGVFCQDQSKKKAEGQRKSDFAMCVNAMAHAAHQDSLTARQACKALSKKHTKGEKGTPFSRCRVGVAQMRKDQDDSGS